MCIFKLFILNPIKTKTIYFEFVEKYVFVRSVEINCLNNGGFSGPFVFRWKFSNAQRVPKKSSKAAARQRRVRGPRLSATRCASRAPKNPVALADFKSVRVLAAASSSGRRRCCCAFETVPHAVPTVRAVTPSRRHAFSQNATTTWSTSVGAVRNAARPSVRPSRPKIAEQPIFDFCEFRSRGAGVGAITRPYRPEGLWEFRVPVQFLSICCDLGIFRSYRSKTCCHGGLGEDLLLHNKYLKIRQLIWRANHINFKTRHSFAMEENELGV